MKIFFDTSCLVAAFHAKHIKHDSCLALLRKVHSGSFQAGISTHSIAEIYSVLTRLPGSNRVSHDQARDLIQSNLKGKFSFIELTGIDYIKLIDDLSSRGHGGGLVYDAIILECALKFKPDKFYTLNLKHFKLLSANANIKILEP